MMVFLFLGVPSFWHKMIALVSGLIIIIIAYNLPHEKRSNPSASGSSFVENNNNSSIA
ncbi:MAG: hypothetical protein QG640_525 [Patescibacteria group bacterium]|nr:hypothetical protein [Patescibacteria group bacterium]